MISILSVVCYAALTDAAKKDVDSITVSWKKSYKTFEECEDAMEHIRDSDQACEASCIVRVDMKEIEVRK